MNVPDWSYFWFTSNFQKVASKTRALRSFDFDSESLITKVLYHKSSGVLLLAVFSKSRDKPYDHSGTFMDLLVMLGLLDAAAWFCGDGYNYRLHVVLVTLDTCTNSNLAKFITMHLQN